MSDLCLEGPTALFTCVIQGKEERGFFVCLFFDKNCVRKWPSYVFKQQVQSTVNVHKSPTGKDAFVSMKYVVILPVQTLKQQRFLPLLN